MGRHHLKLPDHLYLTPPPPQPASAFSSASSFFSTKTGSSYPSTSFFETTSTRRLGNRIPGFKTSAAFLTALRANLDLQSDSPESPASTPDSLRPVVLSSSMSSLPLPSPLGQAASTPDTRIDADLAPPSALQSPRPTSTEIEQDEIVVEPKDPNAIPELITFAANDEISRIEALRLVADSVAQQRQRASRALIFHPLTAALLAVVFGLLRQYMYKGQFSDYALIATTFFGVLMTVLVSIRAISGGYLEEAEKVGTWRWLGQGREAGAEQETGQRALGDSDEILVTKFGDEYIGTIVFRGVQPVNDPPSSTKKSRKGQSNSVQSKTEIRAWTVRQRFRGKGVGTALMEDAIKASYQQGWANGGIEIAADHANHKSLVPTIFAGFVAKNEARARTHLDKKVQEHRETNAGNRGGKRRR